MRIGVDGDGVSDGEGVNSRAVLVVLENFMRFICLKVYSRPDLRIRVGDAPDSVTDKSSSPPSSTNFFER